MAGLASRLAPMLIPFSACERRRLPLRSPKRLVELSHEFTDLVLELLLPLHHLVELLLEPLARRTLPLELKLQLAFRRHPDLRSRRDRDVDPLRTGEEIRNLSPRRYPCTGDFIVNSLLGGNSSITQNGFHQAIRVGNTVFDNFFRAGVTYDQYVSSLHAVGGVTITTSGF